MERITEDTLDKIFSEFNSLPFLFVGAGLSRRYLGTDSWEGLLKEYAKISKNSEFGYRIYQEEAKQLNNPEGILPKIATLIENDFNGKWFTHTHFEESRERFKDLAFAGVSPFKIQIADDLSKKQIHRIEEYKTEIELFKSLSGKNIGGIITTNYDDFLEQTFSEFGVFIGQEQLIFSDIQGIGEIYKIHGCVSEPETILINEKDYIKFNEKNAYLAAKILTIFIEHPIIFIGYSINDTNIESILKSITVCLNSEQLDKLKNRFIFVEWNNTKEPDSVSTYEKSFGMDKNIVMTRIKIKDYSMLYSSIQKVKFKYKAQVLRRLKSEIAALVLTNNPSSNVKVVNLEDDSRIEDIEIFAGVGVIKELSEKGYEGINVSEIFEDVIYNRKNFDVVLMVEKSIPMLLKRHSNSIPFYKYIKDYQEELPEAVKKEVKIEYDSFLNGTILRRREFLKGSLKERSVQEISNTYTFEKSLEFICYLQEKEMDLTELEEFLQKNSKNIEQLLQTPTVSSNFRRIVKIYDWLKYYRN